MMLVLLRFVGGCDEDDDEAEGIGNEAAAEAETETEGAKSGRMKERTIRGGIYFTAWVMMAAAAAALGGPCVMGGGR